MSLVAYLRQLNSADSQQGIWVNPENTDDYIVRPRLFGWNAQTYGDRVCIGTLDSLSFGFQSEREAFCCWASSGLDTERMPKNIQTIEFNGKRVDVQPEALYEAWVDGSVDPALAEYIQSQVDLIRSQWADDEAHDFVFNKLPGILQSKLQAC